MGKGEGGESGTCATVGPPASANARGGGGAGGAEWGAGAKTGALPPPKHTHLLKHQVDALAGVARKRVEDRRVRGIHRRARALFTGVIALAILVDGITPARQRAVLR